MSKYLWAAALAIVMVVLLGLGAAVLLGETDAIDRPTVWLAIVPITVFVAAPVFLGSLAFYWNAQGSDESRGYYRRARAVVLALEASAVVALVAFTVLEGVAVWATAGVVAAAAVFSVLVLFAAPRAGARFAPTTQAATTAASGPDADAGSVRRKVRVAAITFVVLLAAMLVVLLVLLPGEAGAAVRLSVQFACVVTSMVVVVQSLELSRRVRAITGGDLGRAAKIGAVVLRGKPAELDDDERVVAARYATAMPAVLAFQAGYLGLLWIGIAGQQFGFLDDGTAPGIAVPILAAAVLVLVAFVPLAVTRIRRARRYARDHADLLGAGA